MKRGKKRRSEKVKGTLFCWCVGCRGTRWWFGVDLGGRLLICLLLFGVALLFYLVVEGRVIDDGELVASLGRDCVVSMRGRVLGGSRNVSPIPGEWTCPGCMRSGCWPTKNTCFRCGTVPLPLFLLGRFCPILVLLERRVINGIQKEFLINSKKVAQRNVAPLRLKLLLLRLPPSMPAAGGLSLDLVVQFLRGLNVPSELLADLQNAVPPPAPKKTVQQFTKEQGCSQLRNKVDITKQQLSKLSKRAEALAKEHTEAAEKVVAKQTELAQLEVELEEAHRLIMQPTPPAHSASVAYPSWSLFSTSQ